MKGGTLQHGAWPLVLKLWRTKKVGMMSRGRMQMHVQRFRSAVPDATPRCVCPMHAGLSATLCMTMTSTLLWPSSRRL